MTYSISFITGYDDEWALRKNKVQYGDCCKSQRKNYEGIERMKAKRKSVSDTIYESETGDFETGNRNS